jgi:hypothetical protein
MNNQPANLFSNVGTNKNQNNAAPAQPSNPFFQVFL